MKCEECGGSRQMPFETLEPYGDPPLSYTRKIIWIPCDKCKDADYEDEFNSLKG